MGSRWWTHGVHLLAAEAGESPTRVTTDADVLVRVKVLADGTVRISEWLQSQGLTFEGASAFEVGHRFSNGDVSVDLLVQSHLGERAERRTVGQNRAPEAVGGAALLAAGEVVPVAPAGGQVVHVPRPNLATTIAGKAIAPLRLEDPDRHLHDLAFLLGLATQPIEIADKLEARHRTAISRATNIIDERDFWVYANDPQAAQVVARIIAGRR